MFNEYADYDGLGLAQLIRQREISAQEVLETAITLCERGNPALNAVVHPAYEMARQQLRQGLPDGPFAGVPMLIKNTGFEVSGQPLSSGSHLFSGVVSAQDSTLIARYRQAGLLLLGKSNTPEFALSFTTEPLAYGATRNPWDLQRTPGGSSGGSAAAVAAGWMPLANASDGAGSTRVPASHCGLFGFKPSRMRNPLGPVAVEAIAGMSTPHAVSWSVRDNAALLDASAGADRGDPYAAPASAASFLQAVSQPPRSLRIGLITHSPLGHAIDPDILRVVNEAASLCSTLGHQVEPAVCAYDIEALMRAWRIILGVNVASGMNSFAAARGIADPLSLLEPVNQQWILEGQQWRGLDYLWAINQLHAMARAMGQFFSQYDILLSPVTSETAPLLGEMQGDTRDLDAFYQRFWQHGPFTCVFNAAGCPAMSVPLGISTRGLPIGVHFGAAFGEEATLFALAGQLELVQPWFKRRPSIHSGVPHVSD
ncbi:amidase [Erwinia toletana]|uniref:Amidase n=1 Tax=Winslowiella toletana TaxID=92490 RepID=A0ABS4PBL1_9GAMM|nr:amidase [Winslowiella toletana]MBP2170026.1 amidase [Winslowiella toletana]